MSIRAPHFLLMSETSTEEDQNQWRFVLASTDGDKKLVASDTEPAVQGERLELLSVVRGLEALEQPSQVTLLTDSRYVSQGIAHGLSEWRTNDWCWERFGELTPVKNLDLWQRVDHAMKFHRVDCRTWRFDSAHTPTDADSTVVEPAIGPPKTPAQTGSRPSRRFRMAVASVTRPIATNESTDESTTETTLTRLAQQPKPRSGMLAACRTWLEHTTDAVRGLQSKVALEAQ